MLFKLRYFSYGQEVQILILNLPALFFLSSLFWLCLAGKVLKVGLSPKMTNF